jgi:hypothetical protein
MQGYCTKYSNLLNYSHVSNIGKHQSKPNDGGYGLADSGLDYTDVSQKSQAR